MKIEFAQLQYLLLKKDLHIDRLECEIEDLKEQKKNLELVIGAATMQLNELRAKYEPPLDQKDLKIIEFLDGTDATPPAAPPSVEQNAEIKKEELPA